MLVILEGLALRAIVKALADGALVSCTDHGCDTAAITLNQVLHLHLRSDWLSLDLNVIRFINEFKGLLLFFLKEALKGLLSDLSS